MPMYLIKIEKKVSEFLMHLKSSITFFKNITHNSLALTPRLLFIANKISFKAILFRYFPQKPAKDNPCWLISMLLPDISSVYVWAFCSFCSERTRIRKTTNFKCIPIFRQNSRSFYTTDS